MSNISQLALGFFSQQKNKLMMYRLVHVVSLGCMFRHVTDNFFLWLHLFSFLIRPHCSRQICHVSWKTWRGCGSGCAHCPQQRNFKAEAYVFVAQLPAQSAQPENLNEHASECKGSVDLFSKMQELCLVFYSFLYDRNNCSINQREQIPRNPNESNDIECTSHNPQNTDQHSHPTQTAQLIPPQPQQPSNSPNPS